MLMEILDESRGEEAASEELLLTVKEYASRYGLHVQTIYSAIRRGLFPHRVERPTSHTIRIAVSRESIKELKSA